MMSMDMKEAYAAAEKYDSTLKSSDPRFKGMVIVQSLDNFSSFTFANAFAMHYKEYHLVFTEGYGFHAYHEDEAIVVMFTKRTGIDELKFEDLNEKK